MMKMREACSNDDELEQRTIMEAWERWRASDDDEDAEGSVLEEEDSEDDNEDAEGSMEEEEE